MNRPTPIGIGVTSVWSVVTVALSTVQMVQSAELVGLAVCAAA